MILSLIIVGVLHGLQPCLCRLATKPKRSRINNLNATASPRDLDFYLPFRSDLPSTLTPSHPPTLPPFRPPCSLRSVTFFNSNPSSTSTRVGTFTTSKEGGGSTPYAVHPPIRAADALNFFTWTPRGRDLKHSCAPLNTAVLATVRTRHPRVRDLDS